MLADPNISIRIRQIQEKGAEIAGLDAAKIAREIDRVAHSDIAGIVKIVDGNPQIKLPHELDPATRAAVASFKIDEYGRIEYKFWDKNTALTNAAKITGMFEKDNEQKGKGAAEFLAGLKSNVVGVAKDDGGED